jgi:hypothetical protein
MLYFVQHLHGRAICATRKPFQDQVVVGLNVQAGFIPLGLVSDAALQEAIDIATRIGSEEGNAVGGIAKAMLPPDFQTAHRFAVGVFQVNRRTLVCGVDHGPLMLRDDWHEVFLPDLHPRRASNDVKEIIAGGRIIEVDFVRTILRGRIIEAEVTRRLRTNARFSSTGSEGDGQTPVIGSLHALYARRENPW